MGQGEGGVSEIMINSLILILNKEKAMTRGRGVDFGQNFNDVIFEQPLSLHVGFDVRSALVTCPCCEAVNLSGRLVREASNACLSHYLQYSIQHTFYPSVQCMMFFRISKKNKIIQFYSVQ